MSGCGWLDFGGQIVPKVRAMENKVWFNLRGVILACLLAASACAVAADEITVVSDFSQDAKIAQSKNVAILVLFSASGCHFCEKVRQEFLIPMQKNSGYRNKVIFREVEASSDAPLKDFLGRKTTHSDFASVYKVALTPTVKLFDANGREVAPGIVGLLTPDFYGGYLDQAIELALSKIRSQKVADVARVKS